MLCATIRNENIAEIIKANQVADLIEFSLHLFQPIDLKRVRDLCQKPVIFKIESFDEKWLAYDPDYLDLPHTLPASLFQKIKTRYPRTKLICSYHDFEKTENLEDILIEIRKKPADLYKIATMARSSLDGLKMLNFLKSQRINDPSIQLVGLSMGEYGVMTRILSRIAGSLWTYAAPSDRQKTAPGQLLLDELIDIYRFNKLDEKSSIYALIGNPITQSFSHLIHNSVFNKMNLNAVYVKMAVMPHELEVVFYELRKFGFNGLSVTMPLKEKIKRFVADAHDEVLNTVSFENQSIRGWNSDGRGALDLLEKKEAVKGKKIVLLGAGATARSIAMEAQKRGANLTILNRTFSKAEKLGAEVKGKAFPFSHFQQVAQEGYDILIQATSVGMGDDATLPLPTHLLRENRVVMDVVAWPRMTPFLKMAQKKRCKIITGIEMWIEQAVGQYRYWFKKESLVQELEKHLKSSLKKVIR